MKKPNEQGYEYAQSSKEPTRQDAIDYLRKGEPKADPKENRVLVDSDAQKSLKDYGWSNFEPVNKRGKSTHCIMPFGIYVVTESSQGIFHWSGPTCKMMHCSSIENGMEQAEMDFNSKLKLCLNREL